MDFNYYSKNHEGKFYEAWLKKSIKYEVHHLTNQTDSSSKPFQSFADSKGFFKHVQISSKYNCEFYLYVFSGANTK